MSVRTVCAKCETGFNINATNVKEEQIVILEDDAKLFVTYYDCPKCGHRHMVQLDNETTKYLLNESKKCLRKAMAKRRKGKNVSKKIRQEYDKYDNDLKEMRDALNAQYQGKHFNRMHNDVVVECEVQLECSQMKQV